MGNRTRFYINGEWVKPSTDQTADVINPATEEVIGCVAMGNPKDLDKAVAAAKMAFVSYSKTTQKERVELLEEIIEHYRSRMADMAETISGPPGYNARCLAGIQV